MEQLAGGGVEALREALGELKLDTRGHKAVLKKRLRSAHRKTPQASLASTASASLSIAKRAETAGPSRPSSQDFDSYCVVDFEATCQKYEPKHGSRFDFPNEIIEFPVLLLQWHYKIDNSSSSDDSGCAYATADRYRDTTCEHVDDEQNWELVIVDEFRRFVRPTWRPKLTEYCQELTGISQADIDKADTFPKVCDEFKRSFIHPYKLFTRQNKTAWVTDGPWDLRDFVAKQCYISGIERPLWLRGPYIDLRSSATAYLARKLPVVVPLYAPGTSQSALEGGLIRTHPSTNGTYSTSIPTTRGLATPNITAVLKALDLEPFQGRQHSGIDDVKNITRILQELVKPERQWRVAANAKIEGKDKRWSWMRFDGSIAWLHPTAG